MIRPHSSMYTLIPVRTDKQFENQRITLASDLLDSPVFDRGEVHAQKVVSPEMQTRELIHVNLEYEVPESAKGWAVVMNPNLPWADDHFRERISGQPLNPPPSHAHWPFQRAGNAEHVNEQGRFSHTYPERFWPKGAGDIAGMLEMSMPHFGIRYSYGDLEDLVAILRRNSRTRQAYLPVWFPEDLTAASMSERVPCTLGYHFLQHRAGYLDCTYFLRSCDFVRFMADDIYMAGRLLQWVVDSVNKTREPLHQLGVGRLYVHIGSLHAFQGDESYLQRLTGDLVDDDPDQWGSAV